MQEKTSKTIDLSKDIEYLQKMKKVEKDLSLTTVRVNSKTIISCRNPHKLLEMEKHILHHGKL